MAKMIGEITINKVSGFSILYEAEDIYRSMIYEKGDIFDDEEYDYWLKAHLKALDERHFFTIKNLRERSKTRTFLSWVGKNKIVGNLQVPPSSLQLTLNMMIDETERLIKNEKGQTRDETLKLIQENLNEFYNFSYFLQKVFEL